MTALPAAVRAGLPLVIFAGESPLGSAWYNQQLDQGPFVTATGAIYHALHHVGQMPRAVRDAFIEAKEQRRPVVIGVPFDLQGQKIDAIPALPPTSSEVMASPAPMPPNPADVAGFVPLIDGARRIVVLAGLGAAASGAQAACVALADRTGALLATTLPARGLFHGHPHSLGIAGGFSSTVARAALAEADLVIAVGARLAQHTTDKGKLFGKAKVVAIDTAPHTLSQGNLTADRHLRGDARLSVESLARDVAEAPGWRSDRLARAIAETPPDTATFPPENAVLDPRDVVHALDSALPADWQMVNSSGHCSFFFAQMDRPFERFLTIREFGAIGNGISYAIGVAVARPGDTVVMFDGDGSILMHVQELETIRRHG